MRVLGFLLLLLALTMGAAQIGSAPEALLGQLSGLEVAQTADGYRARGVQFELDNRGGALYRVSGSARLVPEAQQALAQLLGAATGYGEAIAAPLGEFLSTRIGELVGQGAVPLGVEEFILTLEVTGEAEPHSARFTLELSELPAESFPAAQHTLGPADAAVVIREFSDFQCPYCAQFSRDTLPLIKQQLLARGDVRFEFHHLPLTSIHANAQLAAEAAECVTEANDADAFWVYHDALFARQQAWQGLGDAQPYFVRLAREVGLVSEGVAACLSEGRYTGAVQQATQTATQTLGLNSTPSVFVGGYRVPAGAAGTLAGYEKAISRLEAFRPR